MELYQIRSFVRVARLGHLTRAAGELNLTQPAVSLQVKALEDEIGEKLFERQGRGLMLTSAGAVLLDRAEQILSLVDLAREEIDALGGLTRGTVRIGTNDSNCLYVLPDVIRTFRQEYPSITIDLANSHSSRVAAWVEEGSVEFGVVTLPVDNPALISVELFKREDVLICRPDHPLASRTDLTAGDVLEYPLLLLDSGSLSHRSLVSTLTDADHAPERVMQVGSIDVIKRYVEIGLGVSVVPRLNVEHEIAAGHLVARGLSWLPRHGVGVIRRKNGYLSPAAREFVERLKADATARAR